MKIRHVLTLTLFFSVVILSGCGKDQAPPATITPVILPQGGQSVITAQNTFALAFFKALLGQDQSASNKLISPLSIHMDFSMVYNGAAGNTLDEMRRALQLGDIPMALLNEVNNTLITGLPLADSRVAMDIANSIWYRDEGPQPLSGFIQTVSESYQAKITGADFTSPQTGNAINTWVAERTRGKINKIIEQVDPADIMYLINAVYFKGQWRQKFESKETQSRAFYTAAEGSVQTPFMKQTGKFRYLENQSMQCVELPYGSGSFSMYILLPASARTPAELLTGFDGDILANDLSSMDSAEVALFMPKWEYSYNLEHLKTEMSSLGMPDAFTQGADFTNMYPAEAGAYISKAIHKTYVAVDEQGTEAVAVTSTGMGTTSVPTVREMDINRPFIYLIAENQTGSILFLGMVNNPAQ